MSIQAYQRAATRSEDPRALEYRAFATVTANLIRARDAGRADLLATAHAVSENRRLWNLLAADCAQPGNALPPEARAGIVSLSLFVDRQSSAAIREGGDLESLIEINRSIMEGLATRDR